MLPLNNQQLSRHSDIIFANDASYYVELPMAGRQQETETMDLALNDCDGPRAVTMNASLGAGKTFFLNKMMARHANRVADFDERKNCKLVFATHEDPVVEPQVASSERRLHVRAAAEVLDHGFEGASGLRVLIVEELDRKASLDQLEWSVETGVAWLALGGDRLLVLSGEAVALPGCQERLSSIDVHFDVTLKSLDVALLKEALTGRICERLVKPFHPDMPDGEAWALAMSATDAVLVDEYIRWSAVPMADPPALANFREALSALRELSQAVVVQNDANIEFPRALLTHFSDRAQGSGAARGLEATILADLATRITAGQPVTAMSIAQLAALVGRDGDARFRRRAVEPLARQGLLTPLGVPYSQCGDDGHALMYVEPFMPGYSMVHHALAELVSSSC